MLRKSVDYCCRLLVTPSFECGMRNSSFLPLHQCSFDPTFRIESLAAPWFSSLTPSLAIMSSFTDADAIPDLPTIGLLFRRDSLTSHKVPKAPNCWCRPDLISKSSRLHTRWLSCIVHENALHHLSLAQLNYLITAIMPRFQVCNCHSLWKSWFAYNKRRSMCLESDNYSAFCFCEGKRSLKAGPIVQLTKLPTNMSQIHRIGMSQWVNW